MGFIVVEKKERLENFQQEEPYPNPVVSTGMVAFFLVGAFICLYHGHVVGGMFFLFCAITNRVYSS